MSQRPAVLRLLPGGAESIPAPRMREMAPPPRIDEPLERLAGERILVTGALGSIGEQAAGTLRAAGIDLRATDLLTQNGSAPLDVRSAEVVASAIDRYRPTLVLHLAGAKSAPAGERDVLEALETNASGTANVVAAAARTGARVVTASTCKACDPETVYGATKLIAERVTIAAGGSVARFYNVVESSGNVFELWRGIAGERAAAGHALLALPDHARGRDRPAALDRGAPARALHRRPRRAAADRRHRRRALPGPAAAADPAAPRRPARRAALRLIGDDRARPRPHRAHRQPPRPVTARS